MSGSAVVAQRVVRYGSERIAYSVSYSPRRDLAITVHPDLKVSVAAPVGRRIEDIDARIAAKGSWIIRQRLRFQDLHPLPTARRYVSGETHRYLGRQYRLKVLRGSPDRVALDRPFLRVIVGDPQDVDRVQRLISGWMRVRAEHVLGRQLRAILDDHPSLAASDARVRIRQMARRWGSCTPSGTITLNPALVRAPLGCIDYVIVHELCHRRVMNHGPQFTRLLSRTMPDWRARRDQLNRMAES